jgi:hypothetical protein
MTPDESKVVAAAANRKGTKGRRNRPTAVVASVNRSTKDEDLFFDSDDEAGRDIEVTAPRRISRPSAKGLTDDDDPGNAFPSRRHPLPNQSTEAPTRSKGKGRHKILVEGTPDPDDTEKSPMNLTSEERCYQELLNARYEVRPTNGT